MLGPSRVLRHFVPLVLLVLGAGDPQAAERNILLIIADDVGVEAASFYPATAGRRSTTPPAPPTPNLTSLARSGVLFRNAWATPWCSPTRATIFTGRYPFRTGIGRAIREPFERKVSPVLSPDEFSLPDAFRAQPGSAYLLAHIGKWHLSRRPEDPNVHGWPYFAGVNPTHSQGAVPDYYHWPKVVNGAKSTSTVYATSDVVEEAIGAIRSAEENGKPWFLWVAFNAAHSPYHKPPNELHSKDELPFSTDEDHNSRPYYEAMVEALDTEIGRLLAEVSLEETTIIFLGDNGTPRKIIARPYDKNHAKSTVYEDGVRIPLLIAGTGLVSPGRVVDGLVQTVDLYPTILELAGIDPQGVIPSHTKIDGVSILPYLRNDIEAGSIRQYAYTEQFPLKFDEEYERAIRNQRYKLIERAAGPSEFFDLEVDPFETNNLFARSLNDNEARNLDLLRAGIVTLVVGR